MITQQQQRYLHAMEIPVWVCRTRPARIAPARADSDTPPPAVPAPTTIPPAAPETPSPVPQTESPPATVTDCTNLSLPELQARVSHCTQCKLHHACNQPLFATGNLAADWLVISDAPSLEADRQNHALAGKAGQLLRNMLAAIDLNPDNTCLTHTVKCRPPNDRPPLAEEQHCCQAYLHRQLALLKPKAVLVLGRSSAQHLLQQKAPLARLRGTTHTLPQTEIPAIVTYHPRNLLRQASDKRKAWEDLKQFRSLMQQQCVQP